MPKRLPTPAGPSDVGMHDGLAYTRWLPRGEPWGGLVILHGAGSCKESHHDFARAARDAGMAAIAFDHRGHGASPGALDGRAIEDVVAIAELLAVRPLALRGSSMGGYLALVAAERVDAAAVVAICPASGEGMLRVLGVQELEFEIDRPALAALLEANDVHEAVGALRVPLLLEHAEGDERIPIEHSRELLRAAGSPVKRLIAMPGGHHRSVQHDAELHGEALRFLHRSLAP